MKKRNLSFKFTLMFASFTMLTLVISSILSYINQMHLYKSQREESIRYVASYLEQVVTSDGDDFAWWQEYFVQNYKDLNIPHNFGEKEIQESRHKFENLFAKKYPGQILGIDLPFKELSKDVKTAYTIFKHEYYLNKFEEACQRFELAYTEYIIPNSANGSIMYALDAMRDPKFVDGKKYIDLGITVQHSLEEHKTEWDAWNSGIQPTGYDIFDNEYGKTYAYYLPLYIGTKKLGVIGVEVNIASVNREILYATIRQMLMIGSILVIFMFFLLFIIRSNFIRKLVKLQTIIESYSKNKNPKVVEHLKLEVTNSDEISVIMAKFAEMIYELEHYIQDLTQTRLGLKNIGVAMIDLNFLKQINDTYGHDKGNIAIITICKIICKIFEHSPVFRIGGDEFVVILRGPDLKNIENLIQKFYDHLKSLQDNPELSYWEKVSAAIGYAIYTPESDTSYDSIFKRADKNMYKNKKAMKAMREE